MTKWFHSLAHAFAGIKLFFQTERNARIELVAACIAIFLSFWLHLSRIEFSIIILCIGAVLSAEAFNSAIERMADIESPSINPQIKAVKDIAAGAVLIISFTSLIIGLVLFGPRILLELGVA